MNNKVLKAKWGSDKTPLRLGEIEIPCYVLEDGTRVISGRGMQKALGVTATSGIWLNKFSNSKEITPHLKTGVLNVLNNPLKFKRPQAGGSQPNTNGYEATVFIDLCDAILEANKTGEKIDPIIVSHAEMIIRSVAKVGIIALIDEVTGYEKIKGRGDLQKFLDKFLLEEKAKWVRTFSDDFFESIYKMKGWDWNVVNKGKKPSVMGHYINNFVYSRIAPKVLTELQKKNPAIDGKPYRQYKHTEFIDANYGHPKLKEHISAIVALAKASGYNWRNFQRLLNRAFPKFGDDLSLDFPDADIVE